MQLTLRSHPFETWVHTFLDPPTSAHSIEPDALSTNLDKYTGSSISNKNDSARTFFPSGILSILSYLRISTAIVT